MNVINEKYGNRARIRVCGIFIENDSILLIKHRNLGSKGILWAPPGGEVEFGESAEEALKREVSEETGLAIHHAQFKFVNEYINPPLHAVELFFEVLEYSGQLKRGHDPEMGRNQIIDETKFVTFNDLNIMEDAIKHSILKGNISQKSLKTTIETVRFKSDR